MKRLKFTSSLIPLILTGEKTATWRMNDDKDLTTGDEVIFVDASTDKEFAQVMLTDVKTTSIHEMTDDDRSGNIEFETKDKLLDFMRQAYGEDITMNSPLKIVRFKVLTEKQR